MGAIKNVIKSIDGTDELANSQKEIIETLSKLAEAKAETFGFQIRESLQSAGGPSNATVPISSIISSTKEIRAFSSSEVANIGGEVMSAFKSFTSGTAESILTGVGTLIGTAIGRLLGEGVVETGTKEDYYVMTDGISVIRIDIKAWYQSVTTKSLRDKMEKISAIVAVKSVVNLAKLDFSTFLYFYQNQLKKSNMTTSEVVAAIAEAKQIYQEFKDVHKNLAYTPSMLNVPPASQS